MKFAHVSDLHLGIDIKKFSLLEDQKFILDQIIEIMDEQKVDGIFIAGDVYDKNVPSVGAINLFEYFLKRLYEKQYKVFVISGNHDGAERLSFGHDFMEKSQIYFSRVYDGSVKCIKTQDEYGNLNIYLLPFVKTSLVHFYYPEEEIKDFNDAVRVAVEKLNINQAERNVILCHQNIVGAARCDSESCIFGGLDGVSSDIFEIFDYTALGHIHSPQTFGKNKSIRYCGTPLKYSLSERNHEKSVTIIDFKEKGNCSISTTPLKPLRDVRIIEGKFSDIMKEGEENLSNPCNDDFVHIILKDENEVENAFDTLSSIYKHCFGLEYDNTRTRNQKEISEIENYAALEPMELLDKFYENRNGMPMNEEQKNYLQSVVEEIWGGK